VSTKDVVILDAGIVTVAFAWNNVPVGLFDQSIVSILTVSQLVCAAPYLISHSLIVDQETPDQNTTKACLLLFVVSHILNIDRLAEYSGQLSTNKQSLASKSSHAMYVSFSYIADGEANGSTLVAIFDLICAIVGTNGAQVSHVVVDESYCDCVATSNFQATVSLALGVAHVARDTQTPHT
jgi:hypothetical protein